MIETTHFGQVTSKDTTLDPIQHQKQSSPHGSLLRPVNTGAIGLAKIINQDIFSLTIAKHTWRVNRQPRTSLHNQRQHYECACQLIFLSKHYLYVRISDVSQAAEVSVFEGMVVRLVIEVENTVAAKGVTLFGELAELCTQILSLLTRNLGGLQHIISRQAIMNRPWKTLTAG